MKNNQKNHQPVKMELNNQAGQRVVLAAARRIIQTHQKEIKALAHK